MLASSASWDVCTRDPSAELAPYTAARLREVTAAGFSPRPKLLAPLRVLRVEKAAAGGFNVIAKWKAAERLPPPGRLQLRNPLATPRLLEVVVPRIRALLRNAWPPHTWKGQLRGMS